MTNLDTSKVILPQDKILINAFGTVEDKNQFDEIPQQLKDKFSKLEENINNIQEKIVEHRDNDILVI